MTACKIWGCFASTSSKSSPIGGGIRLVSRVILNADCLTGATGSATIGKGSVTSHRAQRGSPFGPLYEAMTVAAREMGSSCARARKVNGTIVGVRLPPAREGNTTVSAVRKIGAWHEAMRVTFSRVVPPVYETKRRTVSEETTPPSASPASMVIGTWARRVILSVGSTLTSDDASRIT